MSSSPRPMGTA